MDSKKKDTWTWWPMTDWTHRRKTADAQCFGMCGLCVLGQCGLTTRTCAVALWVRGLEKKVVRQVTSCIYFWTELPICVPYHFFSRSVKTEPSCWTWLTLRVMWMPLETHTCMYFFPSLSLSRDAEEFLNEMLSSTYCGPRFWQLWVTKNKTKAILCVYNHVDLLISSKYIIVRFVAVLRMPTGALNWKN